MRELLVSGKSVGVIVDKRTVDDWTIYLCEAPDLWSLVYTHPTDRTHVAAFVRRREAEAREMFDDTPDAVRSAIRQLAAARSS